MTSNHKPLLASFLMYSPADRIRIGALLLLSLFNGILQVVGIVSIMPFVAIISDPSLAETNYYIAQIKNLFELKTQSQALVFFGVITILSIIISNLFTVLEYWANLKFFNRFEHVFSVRLLDMLLSGDTQTFYREKKTDILKSLLSDVDRLLIGSQMALVGLVSDLLVFVFIFSLLLVMDAQVTLVATLALASAYFLVFSVISNKIKRFGKEQYQLESEVYSSSTQAIDLFREIKVAGTSNYFIKKFSKPSKALADHSVKYYTMSFIPVQLVEILAFVGAISAALYYSLADSAALNAITSISVFAFATYRLLPVIKSIFEGVESLTFNRESLNRLLGLFINDAKQLPESNLDQDIPFTESIEFNDVDFQYTDSQLPVLKRVSFRISKGEFVCLCGFSGAGKSTISYLLLGLVAPTGGVITVDGKPLTMAQHKAWQRQIGYVPQKVQLVNGSVLENIAFGLDEGKIDKERVREVAEMAGVHDFVSNKLPQAYETQLGDGAIAISGGEKQRIGIARSLYADPAVLIFDEATNELDEITEQKVLDAITKLKNKTLVFISHKPAVIARADRKVVVTAADNSIQK